MTRLFDYWRSSAAYRLRIALGLLDIPFETVPVNLLTGEHLEPANLARNPQGLVPTLEIDGECLTQSLAVLEYLDETRGPVFLPENAADRARVRAAAYAIAMEIHPVCNLSVARFASDNGTLDMAGWMQHFIPKGLAGVEGMVRPGPFCFGDRITLADICLAPQLYNAERWRVDLTPFPKIGGIGPELAKIPAFAAAHPDQLKPEE